MIKQAKIEEVSQITPPSYQRIRHADFRAPASEAKGEAKEKELLASAFLTSLEGEIK